MAYLRQNTATTITVGPFFDVTDGITPEVSLTVTGCHLTMVVDNAGTPALALDADATASGGDNDMVHVHANDDAGYYTLELTAANTNYLGTARLCIVDTDVHLPVFHEFTIIPANIYDSLIAGSDLMDVNVGQVSGDTTAADNLEAACDGTTYNIGGGAVVAASVTAMVTANTIQISGDASAADNLESACDGTTYNLGGGAIVAASVSGAVGSVTGAVGSVAANGITAASIQTGAIDADALAADALAAINTQVDTALSDVNLDHLVGTASGIPAIPAGTWIDMIMDDGTATYDRTTDSLQALRDGAATVAAVADGVWNEARADHTSAGSFGEGVASVQGAVTGAVASVTGAVGSVTGNVGGNVTGSVGSVTGLTASDVGAIKTKTDYLPSATAGAAGGVFIAGSNAATSITTALTANVTGNITGNLSGSVGSVTGAVGSVTGAVGSVTGNVGGNVTGSVGSIAANGISNASFVDDCIDASILANGAIDNATFAADVGSTAYATNIIALAVDKAILNSNLDHVAGTAASIPTVPAGTWLDMMMNKDGGQTFDPATDSLEVLGEQAAAIVDDTGTSGVVVASIAANAVNASALATDAVNEIQNGLATAAALDAVDNYVDTEVAAIKAVTDKLDTAMELDGAEYRFTTNALEMGPTGAGASAETIAEAVWARTAASSDVEDTFGNIINDLVEEDVGGVYQFTANAVENAPTGGGTTAEIADAVWDEVLSAHTDAGSASKILSDVLADTGTDGVLISSGTGSGQVSLSSGTVTVGTNNDKTGYTASTVSDKTGYSLGASQTFNMTGDITGNLSGSVGSVTGAVGSVTGAVGSVTGAVGSVTGNVGGNVTGSVGSVTGLTASDVGAIKTKTDYLPSATAGSAGGVFIAGSNAATTANITGNITGNLSGSVGSVTGAVGSVTGNVGGNVVGSVASVAGAVGSVTGNVGGNVTGSVGSVATGGITADSIDTGAIDADALAADAVDEILDEVVEGTTTFRQALRLMLAVLAGKCSGAGTATVTFRDIADTLDRVVATVDASGNRSAITRTLT